MAISKKGLRTIIVKDKKYYWKFNEKVFITSQENNNCLLIVDFGWYDGWLFMNDKNCPPDFYPNSITPKFVEDSILFALEKEWKKGSFKIKYRDKKYSLVKE